MYKANGREVCQIFYFYRKLIENALHGKTKFSNKFINSEKVEFGGKAKV